MNIDEELRRQEAFEATPLTEEDKKLYAHLMDDLQHEPAPIIKPSFAADLLRKVEAKKKKEARWEFVLFSLAIAGVLFVVVLASTFVQQGYPEWMQNTPLAPAALLAGLLIIFHFLEKHYLKDSGIRKHLRQH